MRILIPSLIVGVFAVGLGVGQGVGIMGSSAASQHPAAAWHGFQGRPFFGGWGMGRPAGGGALRPAGGPFVAGTVTAVSGDEITIKPLAMPAGGPAPAGAGSATTVELSGSTTINAGFGQKGTTSSIKVGTFIVASGTLSSDGKTLDASRVVVRQAGRMGLRRHMAVGPFTIGKVTGVTGDTITIQPLTLGGPTTANQTGVTTIQLTGSTTIRAGRGESGTASSITVGSYVVATGTVSSDGKTLSATQIMVQPQGLNGFHAGMAFGPRALGKVTAINGNSISIQPVSLHRPSARNDGSVTSVQLSGSTRIATGFRQAGTQASIKVGSYIFASGTLGADGKTLDASRVMVMEWTARNSGFLLPSNRGRGFGPGGFAWR